MLNKKIFIIVCAILLSFLLTLIIFGQRELSHMYNIKEELKTLEKQNAQLKSENLSLKIQIDKLKSDYKYLEDVARDELGLAKEDELIYELKKKHK